MKSLVIFDSQFGNTRKVAEAIGEGLRQFGEASVLHINEFKPEMLADAGLVIVGAPTQRFRPKIGFMSLLKALPPKAFEGKYVAAFDTRLDLDTIHSRLFRFIIKSGGFAAKHISKRLVQMGGNEVAEPKGFAVKDMEGPMTDGELERARKWAGEILKRFELAAGLV